MKVTLDHVQPIAQNIFTFWFRPEKPVRHIAGQFIELRIPHDHKDKRGDKRWFTLSSAPTEELISISTKFADADGSSFKTALRELKPGALLDMASPMGDFVLPKDPSIPLLFVAGGMGITPFRSIIKYLQDSEEKRDIELIYAVRDKSEAAFLEIFTKMGDKFELATDRINAEKILGKAKDPENQYIYLSGPEPMVEVLDKELKSKGFNKKHIQTDFFPGYLDDYSN